MWVSDAYYVFVCRGCGMMVYGSSNRQFYNCRRCKTDKHVVQVSMPYAAKQLVQELLAMHIVPRLSVKIQYDH